MSWAYQIIQRKLQSEHDQIYSDIDQMKSKIRRDPDRYQYMGFLGRQNGALCVVIAIKEHGSLTSREKFMKKLMDMESEFEQYSELFKKDDEVSAESFREGYMAKLKELRESIKK